MKQRLVIPHKYSKNISSYSTITTTQTSLIDQNMEMVMKINKNHPNSYKFFDYNGGGSWWFLVVIGTSEPLTTLEKGQDTPEKFQKCREVYIEVCV